MTKASIPYFVTCAHGLEEAVAAELREETIGAQAVSTGSSGVHFKGDLATGYRANLWLRSGVRVLAEFARQEARGPEELYAWARTLDWGSCLRRGQTFSVDARVWDSELTHSKYAALRIKDALCDVFREKTGERPCVDVDGADLPLFLYLYRDEAILYRDLSGTTLHKRGYRAAMHVSPLNESLAAGILRLAGWEGQGAFCDPMCGSGVFAIEAALLALRRAPGLLRKAFPFERWPDFEKALWKEAKGQAYARARYELPFPILANDHHEGALALARRDAEAAGVGEFIRFSHAGVAEYAPPERPRVVAVNPPWGGRLKPADLNLTWRQLGGFLTRACMGADAWVLSGAEEAERCLGLVPSGSLPLAIGKAECRLLHYQLNGG